VKEIPLSYHNTDHLVDVSTDRIMIGERNLQS
jgi:hypothetical protein